MIHFKSYGKPEEISFFSVFFEQGVNSFYSFNYNGSGPYGLAYFMYFLDFPVVWRMYRLLDHLFFYLIRYQASSLKNQWVDTNSAIFLYFNIGFIHSSEIYCCTVFFQRQYLWLGCKVFLKKKAYVALEFSTLLCDF